MRLPARGEPVGSLVLKTGGPGGSRPFGAAATTLGLREGRLKERFDLVGVAHTIVMAGTNSYVTDAKPPPPLRT